MRAPKVYLAGPFFNEEQKELIKSVTRALEDAACVVFSPMRDGGICPPDAGPDQVTETYKANVDNIITAEFVFAILDYKLPDWQALIAIDKTNGETVSPPLSLPDTGTVFEMGYAIARQVPVITFSEAEPKRINLMLSEPTEGHVVGVSNIKSAIGALAYAFATNQDTAIAWNWFNREYKYQGQIQ